MGPDIEQARVPAIYRALVVMGCSLIPPLFGVCCWMPQGFFAVSDSPVGLELFTAASAVSQVVCLFACSLLAFRMPWVLLRFCTPAACASLVGSLLVLLFMGARASAALPFLFVGVLTGAGISLFMVAWEKVISALFPQEGPGLISLGMLCSPVVFLLLVQLPPIWVARVVALVAAPMCSVALFATEHRANGLGPRPVRNGISDIKFFKKTFLAPSVCGMALVAITVVAHSAVLDEEVPPVAKVWLANAGLFASSLVIFIAVGMRRVHFDLIRTFLALTPALIASLFVAPFLGWTGGYILMFLGLACFFAVQTGLMVQCIEACERNGVSSAGPYALSAGLVYFARLASEVVLHVVHESAFTYDVRVFAVVSFAIYMLSFLFVLVVLKARGVFGGFIFGEGRGAIEADNLPDAHCGAVLLMAHKCSFSSRETDVALLMAQGCDVNEIARKLVVSRETVRSHVKAIYRKTGTHGRDEFVALFGKMDTSQNNSFHQAG